MPSSTASSSVIAAVAKSSLPSSSSPTIRGAISPIPPHGAPEPRPQPSLLHVPAVLRRRCAGRGGLWSLEPRAGRLPHCRSGLPKRTSHAHARWRQPMRCTVSTFLRLGAVARMHGESAPVCGIAGVIALSDRGPDPSVVEQITRRLAHRSDHAWGYYVDGGVGLGVAGPGVVASEGQDQPATNGERSVRVVLDGRIHNAPRVRDGLLRAGHHFRTAADAEVVAHAWEKYGERAL